MIPSENSHIIEIFKQIKDKGLSVAVAVEGGGLRGIVSATLLKVLEDFGLASNIKAISGTSSGAINAAYFLNKDLASCFSLYRNMASKKFIQPLRWPNAMNMKYLFEDQIKKRFSINSSPTRQVPFYISVTELETGKGQYIKSNSNEKLHTLLRASASAPLFTNNKENINNKWYNDGHIELAVPFDAFAIDQYDYVLCLLTQPKNYKKRKTNISKLLETIALRKHTKEFKDNYANATDQYNKRLQQIYSSNKLIPVAVNTDTFIVSKKSTNPSDIDRCIESVQKNFL